MNDNQEPGLFDEMGSYPQAPGHRGVDTSAAAAADIAEAAGRLQGSPIGRSSPRAKTASRQTSLRGSSTYLGTASSREHPSCAASA
jgi:hypothetical protein